MSRTRHADRGAGTADRFPDCAGDERDTGGKNNVIAAQLFYVANRHVGELSCAG